MVTKRRVANLDLEALVLANTRFAACYTVMAAVQAKVAAGEEIDAGEGETAFAEFLAASVHLFTTANTLVKVSNEAAKPQLVVPPKPGLVLP